MRLERGYHIDDAARPVHEAVVSYENVTSAAGAGTGLTIVCAGLVTEPSYASHLVKLLTGDAAGQVRKIDTHVAGSDTLAVDAAFTDNAGAAVTVAAGTRFQILSTAFASGSGSLDLYPEGIYFDAVNGVAGTAYPIGTSASPVDNQADLATIIAATHLNRVVLMSDITCDRAYADIHFIGKKASIEPIGLGAHYRPLFRPNGQDLTGCTVEWCDVDQEWVGLVTFIDCLLSNGPWNHGSAYFIRCIFPEGDATYPIVTADFLFFDSCHFMHSFTIDLQLGARLIIRNCTADGLLIIERSANVENHIHLKSGIVQLNANCTVGEFYLYGDFTLTDNSAGSTVYDHRTRAQQLLTIDCWSVPQEEVAVTAGAGDTALPDVVVAALPVDAVVVKAIAMFKFRIVENTNVAANALAGAQEIQVRDDSPSAWVDAINLVDNMFTLAGETREGGDVLIGAIDVSATVDGNDTYNLQWAQAVADMANLQFNDVQVGLRIWYRLA
jgi:hypothetical protein